MISVIIPVYNCEKYLDESIKSLINQTIFDKLEIIFIDDGSTDRSFEIINGYTEKFSNMKLFTQSNHGVSYARNRGIEKSKGEYIAFFDADDIAESNLYEKLLFLMQSENADMSTVNFSKHFEDGKIKKQKKEVFKKIANKNVLVSFFSEEYIGINLFDKLFKASIVEKISFPVDYSIGEDMYFVYSYLKYCNKVIVDTRISLYQYKIRKNSAMKSQFSSKFFDPIKLSQNILNDTKNDRLLYFYAEGNLINEICKMLNIMYINNSEFEYNRESHSYIQILNNYSLLKAVKYLSKKHFIAFLLMKYSPRLYTKIYRILRIG